ncbi:hypothetical protein BKE38_12575 [Pseudoroseomonas deserti]|uniref:Uncharacterized protein n=1 Tax=Teichococcus deserti TaxID=1817963 RepID=A0A1V2H1U2_9PROT|nr:hypothetical protein [Pseudoroseomonas deserti]ONG53290.1 hypothetical protein BKE38_12575 [Pseudoroseomonas deserti]
MTAPAQDDGPITLPPAGGCLGDWKGWWLQLTCDCGRSLRMVDHLAESKRLPGWYPLPAAVYLMRCRQCYGRPKAAELQHGRPVGGHGAPHMGRNSLRVPLLDELFGD